MFLLAELVEIELLKDFNLPENKIAWFFNKHRISGIKRPPYLGKKT